MRKIGEKSTRVYEVVCNSFPAMWLRLRVSESEVSFLASEHCDLYTRDEDFLIFYDDFLDKYDVKEVISV